MKKKNVFLGILLIMLFSISIIVLNNGIKEKSFAKNNSIKILNQDLNQQQLAFLFSNAELDLKCGEGKNKKIEKKEDALKNEKDPSKAEIKKVNTNSSKTVKSKSAGHKKRDKKNRKKKRRNR